MSVFVDTVENFQLEENFLNAVNATQRIRQVKAGMGDDVGVAHIGLGVADVDARELSHCKPGEVASLGLVSARAYTRLINQMRSALVRMRTYPAFEQVLRGQMVPDYATGLINRRLRDP